MLRVGTKNGSLYLSFQEFKLCQRHNKNNYNMLEGHGAQTKGKKTKQNKEFTKISVKKKIHIKWIGLGCSMD